MGVYRFVIPGALPGLNQFISAERTHRQMGAKLKRDAEDAVRAQIRGQLDGPVSEPVYIRYEFYEANKRRDHDNVLSFAAKVVQDALVKEFILQNDGWGNISGFSATFELDRENPRIVVELEEVPSAQDGREG